MQLRLTSLDRRIARSAQEIGDRQENLDVVRNPLQVGSNDAARIRAQHEAARLAVLQRMGLAESTGPNTWRVRRDFEQVLKAIQQTADRQRTLAAHGALMSDERLPIEVLDPASMTLVEGGCSFTGRTKIRGAIT